VADEMVRDLLDVREDDYEPIPLDPEHWQMAGHGGFHFLEGEAESGGGPGILWYTREELGDFVLKIDWRAHSATDNSGVFLRIPALGTGNPDKDWKPAVDLGYEVQIDDRGRSPETGGEGDSFRTTGAVYGLAAAEQLLSRPVGQWNTFEIEARGSSITVFLNGERVSRFTGDRLKGDAGRKTRGYLGLQNHGPGSRVAFRNPRIKRLG
jgi:hypothetical protein